jgi:hypothetical protein
MMDFDIEDRMMIHRVNDYPLMQLLSIGSQKARNIYKYSLQTRPVDDHGVIIPLSTPYSAYRTSCVLHDNIRGAARINDISRFDESDIMAFTGFMTGTDFMTGTGNRSNPHAFYRVVFKVKSALSNRGTMYNYCVESASPGRLNAYAYSVHVIGGLEERMEFVGDIFHRVVFAAVKDGLPPDFAAQNYMMEYDHHKTVRSIIANPMKE